MYLNNVLDGGREFQQCFSLSQVKVKKEADLPIEGPRGLYLGLKCWARYLPASIYVLKGLVIYKVIDLLLCLDLYIPICLLLRLLPPSILAMRCAIQYSRALGGVEFVLMK